jgi:hypothetical protein
VPHTQEKSHGAAISAEDAIIIIIGINIYVERIVLIYIYVYDSILEVLLDFPHVCPKNVDTNASILGELAFG